jgi:hypothetical protein
MTRPAAALDAPLDVWRAQLQGAMDEAIAWWPDASRWTRGQVREGRSVATGWVTPRGCTAQRGYFCRMVLPMTVGAAACLFGRPALTHLGRWNREFVAGRTLRVLWEAPGDEAWVVAVRYRTPRPLADRGYVYGVRVLLGDDAMWIVYDAASDEAGDPLLRGTARARLHSTAYRLQEDGAGGSVVEHLLVTDLGGRIPRLLQHHALKGPLVEAQHRDLAALAALAAGRA